MLNTKVSRIMYKVNMHNIRVGLNTVGVLGGGRRHVVDREDVPCARKVRAAENLGAAGCSIYVGHQGARSKKERLNRDRVTQSGMALPEGSLPIASLAMAL